MLFADRGAIAGSQGGQFPAAATLCFVHNAQNLLLESAEFLLFEFAFYVKLWYNISAKPI